MANCSGIVTEILLTPFSFVPPQFDDATHPLYEPLRGMVPQQQEPDPVRNLAVDDQGADPQQDSVHRQAVQCELKSFSFPSKNADPPLLSLSHSFTAD